MAGEADAGHFGHFMVANVVVFRHVPRVERGDGAVAQAFVNEAQVAQRTFGSDVECEREVLPRVPHVDAVVRLDLLAGEPGTGEIACRAGVERCEDRF